MAKKKRTTSRGIRHPVRGTIVFALVTLAGIALVWLGIADMRDSGRSGSPWLMLGVLPALLGPIFLVHSALRIGTFRDLRRGHGVIARWTVAPAAFDAFRAAERDVPRGSVMANFWKLPEAAPPGGLDVIVSGCGVLLGDGYFPLSTAGGRRVESVRHIDSDPPAIEFGLASNTIAHTSSATVANLRSVQLLRVPVAPDAGAQADAVVRHYQARLDGHASHG